MRFLQSLSISLFAFGAVIGTACAQALKYIPCPKDTFFYDDTEYRVTEECDSIKYRLTMKDNRVLYYSQIARGKSTLPSYFREYEYYENGQLRQDAYYSIRKKNIADTVSTWYETGTLKSKEIIAHNYSVMQVYAENGALKMVWKINQGTHTVVSYGPDGSVLPNEDLNAKGTGFLNHYTDEGSLDGMCYYRRGKLIPKKCIQLR